MSDRSLTTSFLGAYAPSTLDDLPISEAARRFVRGGVEAGFISDLLVTGASSPVRRQLVKVITEHLDADVIRLNAGGRNAAGALREQGAKAVTHGTFPPGRARILALSGADSVRGDIAAALEDVLARRGASCASQARCGR